MGGEEIKFGLGGEVKKGKEIAISSGAPSASTWAAAPSLRADRRRRPPGWNQPTRLGGQTDPELISMLLGRQVACSSRSTSSVAANAALQTLEGRAYDRHCSAAPKV